MCYLLCSQLERVSVADGSRTVDCHWFEKVDLGSAEVYSLKTVVETPQYLTKLGKTPLSLTPELQQCLRITDEEVCFHPVETSCFANSRSHFAQTHNVIFQDKLLSAPAKGVRQFPCCLSFLLSLSLRPCPHTAGFKKKTTIFLHPQKKQISIHT